MFRIPGVANKQSYEKLVYWRPIFFDQRSLGIALDLYGEYLTILLTKNWSELMKCQELVLINGAIISTHVLHLFIFSTK